MATPYFALYPRDFLADVGHLGNTELGVYWRLLLVYYRDERPLPFDTDRLRRMAMTFSPEECRALEAVVSEFFVLSTEPDGTRVWRHNRADRELASAKEKHAKASEKARKAAEKRWGSEQPVDKHAPSMPEAMLVQCQPEPELSINTNTTPPTPSKPVLQTFAVPQELLPEESPPLLAEDPPLPPKGEAAGAAPVSKIVDLYHEYLPELRGVVVLHDKRKRIISKAWKWVMTSKRPDGSRRATSEEEALEWMADFFHTARGNDWLMGRTARPEAHRKWVPGIEYILSPDGIAKVLESA